MNKKTAAAPKDKTILEWIYGSKKVEPKLIIGIEVVTALLIFAWLRLLFKGYTSNDAEMSFLWGGPILILVPSIILSFAVKGRRRNLWIALAIILFLLIVAGWIFFATFTFAF